MEMGELSNLSINKLIFFTHFLILVGCAQTAPSLPPDVGSINSIETLSASQFEDSDLQLTCGEIEDRIVALRDQSEEVRERIAENRGDDQALGFFASLVFPPLWLAMDNDEDGKNLANRIQDRIDTLLSLRRLKTCSV